jgi:hypothetical protein
MPKQTATKPVTPKPVLEPLRVRSIVKPLKKGEMPILLIQGDYATRYNEASAIKKKAEELMTDMKPIMLPDALEEICRHNVERPWDAIASVKLQDELDGVTRITSSSKYSATTPAIVEELFGHLKTNKGEPANVNNYVAHSLQINFDSSVLLDANGKVDMNRFNRFAKAMAEAAQALEVPNPLSVVDVVAPLPDFHSRRWLDFDAKANAEITRVLPNQITFVPCPKAAKDTEIA